MKNRESAARSRARKQEYTAQLEVQVAKLRQENRLLLEKVLSFHLLSATVGTLDTDRRIWNRLVFIGMGMWSE